MNLWHMTQLCDFSPRLAASWLTVILDWMGSVVFGWNPESRWDSRDPSALRLFLDELAVFFDRQLIYDLTSEWPGPSYSHGRDGYLEFIQEQLGSDADLMEALLSVITMEIRIGPNDICTCGSGKKFKKCHLEVVERIQGKIGVGRVRRIFRNYNPPREPCQEHPQAAG